MIYAIAITLLVALGIGFLVFVGYGVCRRDGVDLDVLKADMETECDRIQKARQLLACGLIVKHVKPKQKAP